MILLKTQKSSEIKPLKVIIPLVCAAFLVCVNWIWVSELRLNYPSTIYAVFVYGCYSFYWQQISNNINP